jgi:hypothetical protein
MRTWWCNDEIGWPISGVPMGYMPYGDNVWADGIMIDPGGGSGGRVILPGRSGCWCGDVEALVSCVPGELPMVKGGVESADGIVNSFVG